MTVQQNNTADVDIHKTLTVKNGISQIHIRHILPSDFAAVSGLLSDMQIPKILFDYVSVIADEDETPTAVIAFGTFRVCKDFYAKGDHCITVTLQ